MGRCLQQWAPPLFWNLNSGQVQNPEKLKQYLEEVCCHPSNSRERLESLQYAGAWPMSTEPCSTLFSTLRGSLDLTTTQESLQLLKSLWKALQLLQHHDRHCGYSNPCDRCCSYSNPSNRHCSWTKAPNHADITCLYKEEEIQEKIQGEDEPEL